MVDVFDMVALSSLESENSRRTASKENDRALFAVRKKFDSFLKNAKSESELNDRIALAERDIVRIAKENGGTDAFVSSRLIDDVTASVRNEIFSKPKTAKVASAPKAMPKDASPLQKTAANGEEGSSSLGWELDKKINSYVASGDSPFVCACGEKIAEAGRKTCVCGRQWNYWTSEIDGERKSFCREVPLRDDKVMAKRAYVRKHSSGDNTVIVETEDGERFEAEVSNGEEN